MLGNGEGGSEVLLIQVKAELHSKDLADKQSCCDITSGTHYAKSRDEKQVTACCSATDR